MNWKKVVGYGVSIWILMFVIVYLLAILSVYSGVVVKGIVVLIAGGLAYYFATRMQPMDWGKGIGLAASWLVIGVVLDALITMRLDSNIFNSKALWAGYTLLVIGTLVGVMRKGGGGRIV